MMLVGKLLGKVSARTLIFLGLVLATGSLYWMVGWSPETSAEAVAIDSIAQGLGLGFVFVPLNTVAFATLPSELRTDGAAFWTLIRNLGSSIGVSVVISQLTTMISTFHSQLTENLTPFNLALQMPGIAGPLTLATGPGREALDGIVTQQAAIMAYSNDFLLMTFVSLAAFPLLLLIRAPQPAAAAGGARRPQAPQAAID